MLRHVLLLAAIACASGCAAGSIDEEEDDVDATEEALGAARHKVTADVDNGGGVILANRPGGFYMGRLLPGMQFDREDAWYRSKENGTDYAWGMAFGHSKACLWIGPSRGKIGFTAGKWASAGKANKGGTLLADTFLFWNVDYSGTGAPHDPGGMLTKGTKVWYRYTTLDGKNAVVFVPGTGWGFVNAKALDRKQTGTWSFPEKPNDLHKC